MGDMQAAMSEDTTASQTILETGSDAKDGQTKCPKCGATDISTNAKTGMLRCNFCRHEFPAEVVNDSAEEDIFSLKGEIIGSGAKDIKADAADVLTLKCTSCGAEVVIDTSASTQARCHWCRNTLSVNTKMENGAVPDMVLPFKLPKKEAQGLLQGYIDDHKFFAHPQFKKEFSVDNIMGVYFPYAIVDANTHVDFSGDGEIEKRRYRVGDDDNSETRYDADFYRIEREFDMAVNDLTVETSIERMDGTTSQTNNIINAILPFDTENCVAYDSNYLKGYTSERRDTDVVDIRPIVNAQVKDIARHQANELSSQYDRGIRWIEEKVDIIGSMWKTAYLPVWLYSYQQGSGANSIIHYVAVNARTKETIGSIPINKAKLVIVSVFIELLSIVTCGAIMFSGVLKDSDGEDPWYVLLLLLSGVVFYFIQYGRYRRINDRHFHEAETVCEVRNVRKEDEFVKTKKGLRNSRYSEANENRVEGTIINSGVAGDLVKRSSEAKASPGMKKITEKIH